MRSLKIGALLAVLALAIAGVAQASGVFSGAHEKPGYDTAEGKVERLVERFEQQATGTSGVTARPHGRRGPRGPRGPSGPSGPQGAVGPVGPKGTFGSVTSVAGPATFLCAFESGSCAVGSTRVECPAGKTLTGGGYTGAGIVTTVAWSAPVGNAWGIIAVNLDEVPVSNLKAVAECAAA
jgi:hypothetical protein